MQANYLNHLIHHPQFGFLFPNRIAVAVLGVPSRHYIDKWRPSLIEGQDWLTLPSETDNTPRVYYTLTGLPKLCDLVNTPPAQALKQQLLAALQTMPSPQAPSPALPGGALVPAGPVGMAMQPPFPGSSASALSHPLLHPSYAGSSMAAPASASAPVSASASTPGFLPNPATSAAAPPTSHFSPPTTPPPIAQLSNHLSATVASTVTPAIAHQLNQSLSRQVAPLNQSVTNLQQTLASQPQQPSLQEVADFYERAQKQAVAQVQTGVTAAQQVQAHTADHCGDTTVMTHNTHTSTSTTDTVGSWLDSQDRLAVALVGSLVFCLVAVSVYCLLELMSSSSRPHAPQWTASSVLLVSI
ncbi:MAG: hypothetical protein AAGD25_15045 [Cyanobacteria bacterium P01_F01_bin.150]